MKIDVREDIRYSEATQFKTLECLGTVGIIDEELLKSAEVLAENKSNVYIKHPTEPNTAIMVFGRNENYAFGVIINIYTHGDETRQPVSIVNELAKHSFSLKSSGKARATMVTGVDRADFNKCQLKIEEAIISIEKYGKIVNLKTGKDAQNNVHHIGYVFDARMDNLMWLSQEEHRAIHTQITSASHMRVLSINSGRIPAFA